MTDNNSPIDGNEPQEIESSISEQQVLTLRFEGHPESKYPLHELRAEHVADVLEGISELVQDFDKAGAFHNSGPSSRDLMVRPAKEGSFLLEVVQLVVDNPGETFAALGLPSISQITWWALRMAKDQVKDFSYLDNGNVKINWAGGTASEVTRPVWEELNKRTRRRKKQLRNILRPLEDARVSGLETSSTADTTGQTEHYDKDDYKAVKPSEDKEESFDIFTIEGTLSAIDFDDPDRWKVSTAIGKRVATVEDEEFLLAVHEGMNLSRSDSYQLRIREDKVTKNGYTTKKWTILRIQKEDESHDSTEPPSEG